VPLKRNKFRCKVIEIVKKGFLKMLHEFFHTLQISRNMPMQSNLRMLQETKKGPESHVTDYRGLYFSEVTEVELQCT
jgi:hypothetical protein